MYNDHNIKGSDECDFSSIYIYNDHNIKGRSECNFFSFLDNCFLLLGKQMFLPLYISGGVNSTFIFSRSSLAKFTLILLQAFKKSFFFFCSVVHIYLFFFFLVFYCVECGTYMLLR